MSLADIEPKKKSKFGSTFIRMSKMFVSFVRGGSGNASNSISMNDKIAEIKKSANQGVDAHRKFDRSPPERRDRDLAQIGNRLPSIVPSAGSTPSSSSSSGTLSRKIFGVLSSSTSSSINRSPAQSTDTSSNASNSSSSGGGGALCCDKCDGKHETDNCPYYRKARDNHPDAQKNAKRLGGTSSLPGAVLMSARVVRQPGDGSCLFHSLSYGLKDGSTASRLRSELCSFMRSNGALLISDTPLKDWVKWDSGSSVSDYASRMSYGSWGGGIEMACLSKLRGVNVHVYERSSMGYFKRISAFDCESSPETKKTVIYFKPLDTLANLSEFTQLLFLFLSPLQVRVLYCGGVHYGECN
jgi:hypothetical protein